MSILSRLFSKEPDPKESVRPLWHRLVGLARDPHWYARCRVADTLEGRFDVLSTVVSLAMLQFEKSPETLPDSARLTELFIEDMEGQLREAGIGDPTVGKKIGKLVGALGGRTGALRDTLPMDDDTALAAAMERNITFAEGGDPACVAARVRALAARMDAMTHTQLLTEDISL